MQSEIKNDSIKISQLPFPILVVDGELKIVEISNAAVRMLDIEDELPTNINNLILELPEIPIRRFTANKKLEKIISFKNRAGEHFWIKIKSFPAFSDNDELYYLLLEDFTNQKLDFELYKRGHNVAMIGSWKVDLVKDVIVWSSMTRQIHEVDSDYVPDLETAINFYKKGEHRERIVEVVAECIEKGTPYDVELIIVTAKGNEKWVRAIGEAERHDGKIVSMNGVFQEIDKRKRQQIEFDRIRRRKEVAIEAANIGVWDLDIVHNDLYWSPKMYELYGVDPKKFNGGVEAWTASLHPKDLTRANKELDMALKGEKPFNTNFRVIKPNGSVSTIHAEAKVIRDDKGNATRMIGVNVDITHKKRKDERLRRLLETTEAQNRKLIDFAYIVSHNVRSNSSNISMLSGMLLSERGREQQDDFLKMIQKSSDQLEETLNDLNEVLKVTASSEGDLYNVLVQEVLEEVLSSRKNQINDIGGIAINSLPKKISILGSKKYVKDIFFQFNFQQYKIS